MGIYLHFIHMELHLESRPTTSALAQHRIIRTTATFGPMTRANDTRSNLRNLEPGTADSADYPTLGANDPHGVARGRPSLRDSLLPSPSNRAGNRSSRTRLSTKLSAGVDIAARRRLRKRRGACRETRNLRDPRGLRLPGRLPSAGRSGFLSSAYSFFGRAPGFARFHEDLVALAGVAGPLNPGVLYFSI